jgi:hypothetical protein
MSKIKSLLVTGDKTIDVEFPELDGFVVTISYVPREDLLKIRNQALVYKFNKRTRQREEEVDNDKFVEAYSERVIKGWKGLKVKHLPKLLPVDISNMNSEDDIPYSGEEALDLLKNSSIFDQFITDTVNDLESFSVKKRETDLKN